MSKVDLTEIKNDMKADYENLNVQKNENSIPVQVEKDFLSLDIVRGLLQLKDGATLAIMARGASENSVILMQDTLKTDEDDVIRWQRVIQKFIRKKFPHWVEKLEKVQDADLAMLFMSEGMKISTCLAIRDEDKKVNENPTAFSKVLSAIKNIFMFLKKPKLAEVK